MYKRILVPLDGSAWAEAVLPHAQELAKCCGAELVLLRVAVVPAFVIDPVEAWATAVEEAKDYVRGQAKTLEGRGLKILAKARWGDPAQEILEYAHQEHIDLIAMATHGRTGLKRVALGSVAEHVLRRTPTPVHLVRAPMPVEA
ncbi:MAG: universal stress protein [Nitrospinae bacterium]|nr:universal stress protein [Nitrospinota bacterium]